MVKQIIPLLAVAFPAMLVSATAIDKRIVGGTEAKEGEIPFIVSVDPLSADTILQCGGALLDDATVVTAAHCLQKATECAATPNAEDCRGRAFNSRGEGGVLANVASFHIHPDFVQGKFDNDIAILKLSTRIPPSNTISYATLPAAGSEPEVASNAIAAGWGSINFGAPVSKTLLQVDLPIVARGECGKKAGESHVCAGSPGKDTCQGDSGGPLIDQSKRTLIGIVSEGQGCGRTGLYTRVGSFIPFIEEFLEASNEIGFR
ncbi:hypothetical protein V2A60_008459 [Cordyceps javanica]